MARVESLSEPAVHRSQQFASFLHLALAEMTTPEMNSAAKVPSASAVITD
jgi:hypothetical protein